MRLEAGYCPPVLCLVVGLDGGLVRRAEPDKSGF